MGVDPDVVVVSDAAALAETAARMITETAGDVVRKKGRFTIALAGGATPRATYEALTREPLRSAMPWDRTWIFFGDERAVPPDHRESNYGMANEALLSKVPIAPEHVFRISADAEDPEAAATEYAQTLARVFGTRRGELPRFDLILLGVGVDGHTASLFPGSPAVKEVFRPVAAVHAAAAAIPQRVTLTLPVLNAAARVAFLAAGAEKAKAIKAVLHDRALLPAGMVSPADGVLQWILDRAAAALLPVAGAR